MDALIPFPLCYNCFMRLIDKQTNKKDLLKSSSMVFDDDMIKAVVDTKNNLIAVDAELHADLEQFLLDNGSSQDDLWGINLFLTEESPDDLVEFDSMINVRPRQKNRSRYVEDVDTRSKILEIVGKLIG